LSATPGTALAALAVVVTILIVDDEPHIVELVRVTLEEPAVRIVEALDGETALAQAEMFVPELILLDVYLPDMSGLDVCRALRGMERFAHTTIVMLTAATQVDDIARGFAAGATQYLTKPFSPLHLLSLVERLLPARLTWLPR
jgi:two-component system phosphate regulon response regulator PhoB